MFHLKSAILQHIVFAEAEHVLVEMQLVKYSRIISMKYILLANSFINLISLLNRQGQAHFTLHTQSEYCQKSCKISHKACRSENIHDR